MKVEVKRATQYANGFVFKSKNRKVMVFNNKHTLNSLIIESSRLLTKEEQDLLAAIGKKEFEAVLKEVATSGIVKNKILITATRFSLDSAKLLVAALSTYINEYEKESTKKEN